MADEGSEGESAGDVVAQSIACVGAGGIGLVEFGLDLTGRIDGPSDLFEVANEFVAAWVDEEVGF